MNFGAVKKRSIIVGGHKTSISLEDEFWGCLREIAGERGVHLSELVASIDAERKSNLSSAIRLFILRHYRDQKGRESGIAAPPAQEPLNSVKHIGSSD